MRTVALYYYTLLKDNRRWILLAGWWAFAWLILGIIAYSANPGAAAPLISAIKGIFKDILGEDVLQLNWSATLAIFLNNIRAAAVMLFLGALLGLVVFLSLTFNGFIIGFLASYMTALGWAAGHKTIPLIFLLGLIPHGIVEIPAFLIAAGFGLRLGFFWKLPYPELTLGQKWIKAFVQNVSLIPLLLIMLFLAAILEVYASGSIIASFKDMYTPLFNTTK